MRHFKSIVRTVVGKVLPFHSYDDLAVESILCDKKKHFSSHLKVEMRFDLPASLLLLVDMYGTFNCPKLLLLVTKYHPFLMKHN